MHQGSWFPSSFPNVFLAKRGARFFVTTTAAAALPWNTKESQKIFQFLDNEHERSEPKPAQCNRMFKNNQNVSFGLSENNNYGRIFGPNPIVAKIKLLDSLFT